LAEEGGDWVSAGMTVLGVFAGSALWWLLLSGGVATFRHKVGPSALRWVNRVSGLIVAGFGLLALAGVLIERV
jgi:arginine exporter protein ArgO